MDRYRDRDDEWGWSPGRASGRDADRRDDRGYGRADYDYDRGYRGYSEHGYEGAGRGRRDRDWMQREWSQTGYEGMRRGAGRYDERGYDERHDDRRGYDRDYNRTFDRDYDRGTGRAHGRAHGRDHGSDDGRGYGRDAGYDDYGRSFDRVYDRETSRRGGYDPASDRDDVGGGYRRGDAYDRRAAWDDERSDDRRYERGGARGHDRDDRRERYAGDWDRDEGRRSYDDERDFGRAYRAYSDEPDRRWRGEEDVYRSGEEDRADAHGGYRSRPSGDDRDRRERGRDAGWPDRAGRVMHLRNSNTW